MTKNQLKKDIQAIAWGFLPFYENNEDLLGVDSRNIITFDEYCSFIIMINNYCCTITNFTERDMEFISIHDIKNMNSIDSIIENLWIYENIKKAKR